MIEVYFDKIASLDTKICDIYYAEHDPDGAFDSEFQAELEGQTEYSMSIKSKLANFSDNTSAGDSNVAEVIQLMSEFALKLPEFKCNMFSGEGVSNLQFHTFITQFDNIVGLRTDLSNSTKFTYLNSFLKGYTFRLVQHWQITDENYEIAVRLLTDEFLNKEALIEDLLKKLLLLKPKHDSFLDLKPYINKFVVFFVTLSHTGWTSLAEVWKFID